MEQGKKMVLSSCGCIYCTKCVQASTQKGCVVCKAGPGKVLPIGKSLPQPVLEMFNRNEESMSKINKRTEFGNRHFKRCLKINTEMEKKLMEKLKAEEQDRLRIKQELKLLEGKIHEKKSCVDKLEKAVATMNIGDKNPKFNASFETPLPNGRRSADRDIRKDEFELGGRKGSDRNSRTNRFGMGDRLF